ncbi:MAG: hypothetical protein ACFFCT_13600 [Candidatus Odinarchaeota archaeon]
MPMGWASFKQVSRYRIPIAALFLIAIVTFGVVWSFTPYEVLFFNHTEYEVDPYPYYFRIPFSVPEHGNLDAYLRVRMEIKGYEGMDNLWLVFMVFNGNLTAFDMNHDPANATLMFLSGEYSLKLSSSWALTSFEDIWQAELSPGDYIWVHFFTTDSVDTASSLSVIVSAVYK